jgi:hypothetical protein
MRFFNVDAMSDEEIIVLHRGLWAVAERGNEDTDAFDQMQVGDGLHEQVAAEVCDLASRDPERVKQLVARTMSSQEDHDQVLAAKAVPGLLSYDYVFTRDTLMSLSSAGELGQRNREHTDGMVFAPETAEDEIGRFIRDDRLTPEQVADFQAHATEIDSHWQLGPIPPGW